MSERLLIGNALDVLPTLESNSVHCSVSSPPYYALRRYDGDQQCDWPEVEYVPMPGLLPIVIEPVTCALGHEQTIESYIGHLVAIYREVHRVLREDGVAWVVMGDSYAGSGKGPTGFNGIGNQEQRQGFHSPKISKDNGFQQGDLMLVPHRLALALQGDGWIVRNDVIWYKKSPMPESLSGYRWERHRVKVKGAPAGARNVDNRNRQGDPAHSGGYRPDVASNPTAKWTDCPGCPKCEPNDGYILRRGSWRHTRAHEVVLMLAKGMGYFADQEAVREALTESSIARLDQPTFHEQTGGPKDYGSGSNRSARKMLENLEQSRNGRNPRSVLSPSPECFPGKHFAVYPTSLIEPLIKATCPARCCPECGAGWAVVVERGHQTGGRQPTTRAERKDSGKRYGDQGDEWQSNGGTFAAFENNILGYRPACSCGRDDWTPGVVLDPFLGSGTTALVARSLGLDCIGIELSEEYVEMAEQRLVETQPPLFVVEQMPLMAEELT